MQRTEWVAGLGQVIVMYAPEDSGEELDPSWLYALIAEDAEALATTRGLRITAMTSMPLRHAAVAFGREGSGYQTKAVVVVTYALP